MNKSRVKKCVNCKVELTKGAVAPHGGKDVYFRPDSNETSVVGFFKSAMKNSKTVSAYMCPVCGKIELFANL